MSIKHKRVASRKKLASRTQGSAFSPIPLLGSLVGGAFLNTSPTWDHFIAAIVSLRETYKGKLLFRGQADSDWHLSTTLERSEAGVRMEFRDYHELIYAAAPEINAFADVDVIQGADADSCSYSDPKMLYDRHYPSVEMYKYMAYLRHHGFPSPMLDWSRSPFVAAFFAFRDRTNAKERSVFVYCDMPEGQWGETIGELTIHHLGPYVQTHHRHFRQQCDYTICARFDLAKRQWIFDSHHEAFNNPPIKHQNYLWKFNIPSTEREKVLGALNDYNLNAFSLFGSEEALLETMWFREYVLKRPKTQGIEGLIVATSQLNKV